ncbi:cation:proton antiporter [Salinivibrio socompensis]|uniref:cation:proton antiporter n=1 Tax=Salinivibrio socompensis TaxID=1510206 RepID=UPI00046FE678|nr:sodium:proton antiporter [Salinivibrio socompensis]
MSTYAILSFLAAAAIIIAFINSKISRVQTTIAITASSLLLSLLIVIVGQYQAIPLKTMAEQILTDIHFDTFLLKGVLGFLLFAGGIGVKLPHFSDQKWEISALVIGGLLVSVFTIGAGIWGIFQLIGIPFDFIYCLLFGSLISPTDPIAVLAIVKRLQAPRRITTQIEGESLFNDGIGIVMFVTLFTLAFGDSDPTLGGTIALFLQEAIGGVVYGLILGYLFHRLICATNDHSMELLLTLAIPSAGYVLADMLHVSGPLAMVVSGIMIGNWTRFIGFSKESEDHLDHFWELVDEFLNSLLFLLIGISLLQIGFHKEDWIIMVAVVPVVLFARYLSVKACYFGFNRFRQYNPWAVRILSWGGLRGGLALAMAMAVPAGVMVVPEKNIDVRELILVMTYAVVVFSILVQGSTMTGMVDKANAAQEEMDNPRV